MKTAFNDDLSGEMLEEVPTSFDLVGDIAIIKIELKESELGGAKFEITLQKVDGS